jgi:hypothetical protein
VAIKRIHNRVIKAYDLEYLDYPNLIVDHDARLKRKCKVRIIDRGWVISEKEARGGPSEKVLEAKGKIQG